MNTDQRMHDLNPYIHILLFYHIVQKLVAHLINLLSFIDFSSPEPKAHKVSL